MCVYIENLSIHSKMFSGTYVYYILLIIFKVCLFPDTGNLLQYLVIGDHVL